MLAWIMFSVALDIKVGDFRHLLKSPKPILIGVGSQFLYLPALTFLLVLVLPIPPSIALGMILVAACPGGSVSNFFSMQAKGNVALSVSLTAIATLSAVFLIPFNFMTWGNLAPVTQPLMQEVEVNSWQMLKIAFWLLVVPLIAGMSINHFFPWFSKKISKPSKIISLLIFGVLVAGAFLANLGLFLELFHHIFWLVLLHNGLAIGGGYFIAKWSGLPEIDRRTISIETGIQNGSVGLVIAFTFFQHLGGMAIIVAWWGIWHLVAGFLISYFYRKRKLKTP